MACTHAPCAVAGALNNGACALIVERRQGIDIHQASQRVAPVQGVLWAAHHLEACNVQEVKVIVLFSYHRHVVDGQSHGRLVDARADAAHIHRRGHAAAIVGDEQVGHQVGCRLDRQHLVALSLPAVDDRQCRCLGAHVAALLDGGHRHLVQRQGVGQRRGYLGRRCCSSECS